MRDDEPAREGDDQAFLPGNPYLSVQQVFLHFQAILGVLLPVAAACPL